MIFNLKNEYDVPKFKDYVNRLFRERAVVEVRKKLPGRTLAQNSYLHLLLGYFGSEYGCSLDEAKIDFNIGMACNGIRQSAGGYQWRKYQKDKI